MAIFTGERIILVVENSVGVSVGRLKLGVSVVRRCASGYYGNPNVIGGSCLACDCNPQGSRGSECDPVTGQCSCLAGITGRACNECRPRYAVINGVCRCTCHVNLLLMLFNSASCERLISVLGSEISMRFITVWSVLYQCNET